MLLRCTYARLTNRVFSAVAKVLVVPACLLLPLEVRIVPADGEHTRWVSGSAAWHSCSPKGIITRRAVAYGSLCWMRRRIWRFSSVIRISSRLRYSLFRLFPKLHRQTDRDTSSRKASRAAVGADARRAAMPAARARRESLQDDHASPRALSLPHGIAPGSDARGTAGASVQAANALT
jgi:hypothetical protein